MVSRFVLALCVGLALLGGAGVGAALEHHFTVADRLRVLRLRLRPTDAMSRRRTDPDGWRRDSSRLAQRALLGRNALPREVARQQLGLACVVALEVRARLAPGLLRITPVSTDGARGIAGLLPVMDSAAAGTVLAVAVPDVECARVGLFNVGWTLLPALGPQPFHFAPPPAVPPAGPARPTVSLR